jgi:hypothetical protein
MHHRHPVKRLVSAGVLGCLLMLGAGVAAQNLTNPVRYRVTYRVEITNTSCQMDTLEIWIPDPIQWISQRDVAIEDTSPVGDDTFADSVHGNGIRHWLVSDPPEPGETLTVLQIFTYVACDVSYDIDPSSVNPYDPTSDVYQTYTVSEDKIESAHPDMQLTAWSIVGSETNPYYKAQLIYDWVMGHLYYQDTPEFGGALQALYDGYGECGDYAALFCALLRAVGVPARTVAGWIAETGASRHVWAEFYLPGYGWVPADPSWDDGNITWRYFAQLPTSDRLISSVGTNIELASDWTASLFQTFSWRWWGISGERNTDCSITAEEIGLGTPSAFRIDEGGDMYSDRAVHAHTFAGASADLAEWVRIAEPVAPGDVLELDPMAAATYRPSQTPCSSLVAGVVSTAPGVVLGGGLEDGNRALLALAGIVPVKVTNEGGLIQPGDLLVTSSTPAHAMRWAGTDPCPCVLIGKALQPMTDDYGVILVLLTAH